MAVKIPSKLGSMSLTFQKAWYKKNKMPLPPHLTSSVAQASKEVKPSERVKQLQAKSIQAYGATKGLKVGGEYGSGEMRDTVKPLTRDQWSKVQAAERAAKAAAKTKKPLSKSERLSAIAAAVRKSKTKHDVATVDPDDMDHDDLRDLHQSLHVRKTYSEETMLDEGKKENKEKLKNYVRGLGTKAVVAGKVPFDQRFSPLRAGRKVLKQEETKPDASMAMTHTLKMKALSDKDKRTLGKVAALMAAQKKKIKEENEINEGKMKDIVTNRQETERLKAQDVLGGPVKTRTGEEPKGKLPLGFRRARNLARQAVNTVKESTTEVSEVNEMNHGKKLAKMIMAKQSQHPIAQHMGEAIKDAADVGEYDYEGDMAKSQLRSILTNAKRLHDMLDDQTNLPEWVQSKITLAEDYILTAANYMEGEMNEEVEQVDEKIDLAKAKMGDVVKDFYKSKAPQFKGKSMAKRREMAVAAKLGAEREAGMREEVEQIDEQSPAEIKAKYYHDQFNKVKPVKAYDKEGKLVGHYRSMAHAKQMKPGHTYKEVKEEVVTEAEGKVAVTPKEKDLAAHHGDKTRITYGDVIKARLKSAAAKKMGKQ